MPYEGHRDECFTVENQRFCYSDYGSSAGFNNSASHGGPIREGLPVRVSYVGGSIVRLEVRDDAITSFEQRTKFSDTAKAESQKRMERDPVTRRVNLGFGIAAVFITGWWNVQWRRLMKFWIKGTQKPIVVLLFRAFLAANFVGSICYLIRLLLDENISRSELMVGVEISVGIIGVVWLMVNVTEWMNRRAV